MAIALLMAMALLFLVQLWSQLFTSATFFKLITTLAVVLVVIVVVALIRRDYVQDKRLKDKGLID
jgi:uncharacterized membrane protein YcjF (UPF0283 family)